MADPESAGAVLTIDTGAIRANYSILCARSAPAQCAAVVKADAYGLGAARIAPVLAAAGCRTFFVATVDEALALRQVLDDERTICVLSGITAGIEDLYLAHRLIPVLNALGDLDAWTAVARRTGAAVPVALHVDTGMSRLGLPEAELAALSDDPSRLDGLDVRLVMSHLACADEPDSPMNSAQLQAFRAARQRLPAAPASFANSAGVFLGRDYHMDLARPGIALYGGAPYPQNPNPMAQVVRLQAKILQVREIDRGRTVGYGATHRADRRERIATIAVGYADGYLRSLSGRGNGTIDGIRVPLVGRVSMDLVTFDVSGVPEHAARPGATIDLIGPHNPIDVVAADAGTIAYEILTSLGARYHRVYRDAAA